MEYQNFLKTIITSLKAQIRTLTLKLQKAPRGYLLITRQDGYERYYQAIENKKYYIAKSRDALITDLAQKEYDKRVLEALKKQEEEYERQLAFYSSYTPPEEIINTMPEELRGRIKPYAVMDAEAIENWLMLGQGNFQYSQSHRVKTKSGIYVRSKSEAFIADALFEAGIPFIYEDLLCFRTGNPEKPYAYYRPDFKILNVRTGNTFYWEHLGMLGIPDYVEDNLAKLEAYSLNGIIPFRNLILTYESDGHPINREYVDQMIQRYLL